MLTEAALSFLSIGVQPPEASWGTIILDGQGLLYTRPAVALAPGIAIAVTVLALNVLGDGIRDALDPRAKHRGRPLMLRFVARRLVSTVFVMFAISVLVFLIFFATPGVDPAARIAGRNADQETLRAVRKDFGLDKPMPVQYALMMKKLFVSRDLDVVREPGREGDPAGAGGRAGDDLARARSRSHLGRPEHRRWESWPPSSAARRSTRC